MKKTKKAQEKKLSALTITLATIASCIVALILYLGIIWLFGYFDNNQEFYTDAEIMLILLLALGFIIGPGLIAAIIVIIMLKKNKKI